MRATRLRTALSPQGFYGWHIVLYSAIALAATGPGQTVGVSMFIDPIIADLDISRSAISTAYLIGTLAGAVALPWIGRALDRFGVRRTMAIIGLAFGAILILMSLVSSVVGLTAGFAGIRMAGQGALGLTATTAVALWFDRKRGTAAGLVSAFGAVGISSTPLLLEGLIADHGWRTAWIIEGVAIWIIVLPLALLAFRDRPADLGQRPDGAPVDHSRPLPKPVGYTRGETLRHPYFWLIATAVLTTGLLSTAVAFHQISLLTARGLGASEAAANFIPQTVAGLVATLLTGYLLDRIAGRWILVGSMVTLALSLLWATMVTPGWSAIGFGMVLGASASMIRTVEAAALPRYFGTKHIGSLRGLVVSVTVAGTAVGPLIYALAYDTTGSYAGILIASAALPIAIALWAWLAPEPERFPDPVQEPRYDGEPDEHDGSAGDDTQQHFGDHGELDEIDVSPAVIGVRAPGDETHEDPDNTRKN